MVQIEFFQSKFYNSLKSVEAIIKTGKDIIYCTDIAADIGKYQKQTWKKSGLYKYMHGSILENSR